MAKPNSNTGKTDGANTGGGTNRRGAESADGTMETKELKDCLDALEKLKIVRRELKGKLSKEGLSDDDEIRCARDLTIVSTQIQALEWQKLRPLKIAAEAAQARRDAIARGEVS